MIFSRTNDRVYNWVAKQTDVLYGQAQSGELTSEAIHDGIQHLSYELSCLVCDFPSSRARKVRSRLDETWSILANQERREATS